METTPIDIIPTVSIALDDYLTQKVWNATSAEYRHNIIPHFYGYFTSSATVNHRTIRLPNNRKAYYLYYIPRSAMEGPVVETETQWIEMDKFLALSNLILRVHGDNGQMFYRGEMYISNDFNNNGYYLAADKVMIEAIDAPFGSLPKSIFIAPYYDSKESGKTTLSCFNPKTINDLQLAFASCLKATTIYLNGYEAQVTKLTDISIGDYVETLVDNNVICTFDIDLQDSSDSYQFFSTKDNCFKQIVHIPKALNPNGRVITNNTCDVFIRPVGIPSGSLKGLFMHRCQTKVPIAQITHNDFSIPIYVIESYKAYLKCDQVTLHVICRDHGQVNYLVRNSYYMDLLYTQSDEIILKFISEALTKQYPNLSFWKGSSLEESLYVQMVNNVPFNIEEYGKTIPADYFKELGVLNSISLLSESIVRGTIPEGLSHEIVVPIPTFFRNEKLALMFYINGLKINDDLITVTGIKDNSLVAEVNSSVVFTTGDESATELFLNSSIHTIAFKPEAVSLSVVIPYGDILVYEEISESVAIQLIEKTSNIGYVPYSLFSISPSGLSYIVTFPENTVGKTFIIQNSKGLYSFTLDINDISSDKDPFVIDLVTAYNGTPYPILGEFCTLGFLNGKTLIKDIDYKIYISKGESGSIVSTQAVIQNMDYLKPTDNKVEFYAYRAEDFTDYGGFFNTERDTLPLESIVAYYPQISMFSINGDVKNNVEVQNHSINLFSTDTVSPIGSIYGTRTFINPNILEFFKESILQLPDTKRISYLRDYFISVKKIPAKVIIPRPYKLYSLFLSIVFRDIVTGEKSVVFDPNITALLAQIKTYNYLKDFDLIFNGDLDFNFIDAYPIFYNYVTTDMKDYIALTMIAVDELPQEPTIGVKGYLTEFKGLK